MTMLRMLALFCVALIPACKDAEGEPPAMAAVDQPTFSEHVAPIIWQHCASCHRPGEAAPFSLLTYEDVRRKRRQIVKVTRRGIMPPWLPSRGHVPLVGERRLSPTQIATLGRWVDQGAVRGDVGKLPPRPTFPSGWQLREPDLVVTLADAFELPSDGADVFRNFVIPISVPGVRYVEAFELRPGSAAVHHAILQLDRGRSSRRADVDDPGPGFAGMSMAGSSPPDGHFLGWTLGKQPRPMPSGMAWRLHPGSDLVLQLHLTPTGKLERIQPKIGLFFTSTPPTRQPVAVTLFSEQIDIPPGNADYVVRDHFDLPVPVDVIGIYPHAHYLCRHMRGYVRLPDGSERTLIEIESWDFDWQDDYQFREPLRLPAGARLGFVYTYDNSAANPSNPADPPVRVRFGQSSTDEMGTLSFSVLPVVRDGAGAAAARLALREARWRGTIRKKPWDWDAYFRLAQLLRSRGDIDGALEQLRHALSRRRDYPDALVELGACMLDRGHADGAARALQRAIALEPGHAAANYHLGRLCLVRKDESGAERAFRKALAAAPEWVDVHSSLGTLLARRGNAMAAIPHFRRIIALRPQIPEGHNNLATALFTAGKLGEAVAEYRVALELRPNYFNARLNLGRALIANGQEKAGRIELEKAGKLQPNHPAVRAALFGK